MMLWWAIPIGGFILGVTYLARLFERFKVSKKHEKFESQYINWHRTYLAEREAKELQHISLPPVEGRKFR